MRVTRTLLRRLSSISAALGLIALSTAGSILVHLKCRRRQLQSSSELRGARWGGINTVRLTWSGATSNNIDVNRNRVLLTTVPNTGTYTDSTGDTGRARYTYKVCEAGTSSCSNDVTVRFRH